MGNAAVGTPQHQLSQVAEKLVHDEYEGKSSSDGNAAPSSASSSSTGAVPAATGPKSGLDGDETGGENTLIKVHEVEALVKRLQQVRIDIEKQSKAMSESKVIEKMTSQEMELERREIGTFHVSRDRTKSMEEYTDGTTIRRIDGSVERKQPDGTIEQISVNNEVTMRTVDGDIAVLADHDTLLNQKLADGTQIQTNLETRVQIKVFPDGRRIETDAKTNTVVTLFPDGKQVTVFDDNTKLTMYPDGRSHQVSPNGTVVTIAADGTKEQTNPDGSSIVVYPDGRKVRTLANGTKLESFPNGITREIDVNSPKFGERKKPVRSGTITSEAKDNTEAPGALPSLSGSPGVQRTNTATNFNLKKGSMSPSRHSDATSGEDDDTDGDDEFDHSNTDRVRVNMSVANLVGAIEAAHVRHTRKEKDGRVGLKDLNSAQVIRLINEWGFEIFAKDFATKRVDGTMLHNIESMGDPLLSAAPSSLRKDFFYRLQQAKKSGLNADVISAIESPTTKFRRALGQKLHLENNSLDKSKLMWGSNFDPENIKNWVSKGAFIDWHNPDERGCTIVHMVSKAGRLDALEMLVSLKADVNALNNRKTTALHLACRKGHVNVVKKLLDSKANPRLKNKKGTPLDEARATSKSAKIANMRANIVSAFGHLDQ